MHSSYLSVQKFCVLSVTVLRQLLLVGQSLQCFIGVVQRTDTKFKQQKLPAWQPIMTAGTVLPVLFAVGVAFIPLGVALLVTSNNVSVLHFTA